MLATTLPAHATEASGILRKLDRVITESTTGPLADVQVDFVYQTAYRSYGSIALEENGGGLFLAVFTDLHFGENLRFYGVNHAQQVPSAASTVKTVLLCAVLHEYEMGNLDLGDRLNGKRVDSLMSSMISESNNDAANLLIRYLGMKSINDWLSTLGFEEQEISFGRHFYPTDCAFAFRDRETENLVTAAGMAKFYFLLAQETDVTGFLSLSSIHKARKILNSREGNSKSSYNDRLNGAFPAGSVFYHKTGSNAQVVGDAGIASIGGTKFIIAAYDTGKDRAAMRRLGKSVYEFVSQRDT